MESAVEHQETRPPEVNHLDSRQPESILALNKLLAAIENRTLRSEDITFLKKELHELASLLPQKHRTFMKRK